MPFLGTLERGQSLAGGWGAALGQGLSALAHEKIKSMDQKHIASGFEEYGATPEQAKILARSIGAEGLQQFAKQYDPRNRQEESRSLGGAPTLGAPAQPNQQMDLQGKMLNLGNQANQRQQQEQLLAQQLQQGQFGQAPVNAASIQKAIAQGALQNRMGALGGQQESPFQNIGQQVQARELQEQRQAQQQQAQQLEARKLALQEQGEQPLAPTNIAETIKENEAERTGFKRKKDAMLELKKKEVALKEESVEIKKQEAIEKIERPKLETDYKAFRDKQEVDQILDEMEANIKSGELPSATWAALADGIEKNGILGVPGTKFDFHSWLGSTYERQAKLTNQLVSKVAEKLRSNGGRQLTNLALQNVLGQVPRGSQSIEAQELVVNDIRGLMNTDIAPIKYEEKQKILEANGGIYPNNLDQLAERRARVIRDERVKEINQKYGKNGVAYTPFGQFDKVGDSLKEMPNPNNEKVGTQFLGSDGKLYEVDKDHTYFIAKGNK